MVKRYNLPRGCFECDELFSVEDGFFVSCDCVGVQGPELDLSLDRQRVWTFFNDARLKKEPLNRDMNICPCYRGFF